MEIRVLTIEDYPALYALWQATPGLGLVPHDDTREGIGRYLARNPTTSFAAVEDGEIIGCVLAGHDGRRGFIYHMVVREDCRHRGIGTALVEAVREALAREGIYKAALVAKANNALGNGFWESHGFTTRPDLTYRNAFILDEE